MEHAGSQHIEPVVFGTAFEGLLVRGLGARLTPQAKVELRAIGVDLDKAYAPAYTPEQWVETIEIAARRVFPGKPAAEAHFEIGRIFMQGLERTLIGKAIFAYGRLVGPRRMLGRLTKGFRSSNNYLETQVEERPDGLFVVTRATAEAWPKLKGHPETSPHYMRGIVYECLLASGAKDARVEIVEYTPEQRIIRLKVDITG
jgi:uncharacterized protein (TIGR02265 family)